MTAGGCGDDLLRELSDFSSEAYTVNTAGEVTIG